MSNDKDIPPPAVYDDLDEWREFIDRIDVLEVPIEAFLDTLVPAREPYVPSNYSYEQYPECLPQVNEPVGQSNLTGFLSALLASFPSDKKVSFLAGDDRPLQAPFGILEPTHHLTAADVAVSLPGKTLKEPAERWQQLSMAIVVESRACCDPFDRDDLLCHAVAHSAACARNLMLAHGLLASFVLGIYGTCCRILRFDHTCGLVSEAFDYTERSDLLRQFFWHFVHPHLGDTVVGCDPTVHALEYDDVVWTTTQLAEMTVDIAAFHPREARRVDVHDGASNSLRSFVLLKALSAQRRLFSRATIVWLAVEDVRGRADAAPQKPVIIKEAWRELETRSEAFIYQTLQHASEAERFGLPRLVCGGDLGEREVALWRAGGGPPLEQKHHPDEADTVSRQPLSDRSTNTSQTPSLSAAHSAYSTFKTKENVSSQARSGAGTDASSRVSKYPLPFPQHQTYSWRLTGELEYSYRERSQMRLVIDVVGRPLSEFGSTKQLVRAIRDAVRGHENAWKMGILHRDISEGNVLIVDEDLASFFPFTAFLHDFDYSWFEFQQEDSTGSACTPTSGDQTPTLDNAVLLGQTGTPPFMAIEIHKQRTLRYLGHAVKHDVHHDLESVYWLLVWMVLRHARYLHVWGPKAERTLFGCSDHTFYASMKAVWLDLPPAAVWDNAPLTRLLGRFTDAVRANNPGVPDILKGYREPVHLTHADVLKMLDDALETDDWPDDDDALCRREREAWRTHSALRPGEKRPHDGSRDHEFQEEVLGMTGDQKRRKT